MVYRLKRWSWIKVMYSNIKKFVAKHKKKKTKLTIAPWWSREIKREVRARCMLRKEYTRTGMAESFREICLAKKQHYREAAQCKTGA